MAKKGQYTKSEFIPIHEFRAVTKKLARDENWKFELYFIFSVATALRVCDVLSTKWGHVIHEDRNGNQTMVKSFKKLEKKTKKIRVITLSESVANRIFELYQILGSPDIETPIFANRDGIDPWSNQYINAELKRIRNRYKMSIDNFSTHSFRKTFARHYWESNERSSGSLILLMDVLNHSSLAMTRKYLGISDEEIAEVYNNFEL